MSRKRLISEELLMRLADNNSFSEELIKAEYPELFEENWKLASSVVFTCDEEPKCNVYYRKINDSIQTKLEGVLKGVTKIEFTIDENRN
jgi:hypothetical protein